MRKATSLRFASFAMLSGPDAAEVMQLPKGVRGQYAVMAVILPGSSSLTVVDGNSQHREVPLAVFSPAGNGLVPDFDDLGIEDCGQTIRFGRYEASTEYVLGFSSTGKGEGHETGTAEGEDQGVGGGSPDSPEAGAEVPEGE